MRPAYAFHSSFSMLLFEKLPFLLLPLSLHREIASGKVAGARQIIPLPRDSSPATATYYRALGEPAS